MFSSRSRTAALPAPVRRCFPVLLLPAFGALASAQSVGAISGSIRDSAGVPIPGVEVSVQSEIGEILPPGRQCCPCRSCRRSVLP